MTDTAVNESFVAALIKRLPEPVRRLYKTKRLERLRQSAREKVPHAQNIERAVRFWANPFERRRRLEELQRCRTPEDYFDFATRYLGHLQWKQEFLPFLDFAAAQRPVRIGEVGLYTGGTHLMLTRALPTVKLSVGVDLHVRNKSQLRFLANSSHRGIFVEGKSCEDTTLQLVRQALGGEKLDLLLIDADHSYTGVKQDFMHYRRFVRDGGIIAFHDIVQDHLTRFNNDPATWMGSSSGEVHVFWKKLKPYYEKTREFVIDYDQDGCGIGALIYSSEVAIPADL